MPDLEEAARENGWRGCACGTAYRRRGDPPLNALEEGADIDPSESDRDTVRSRLATIIEIPSLVSMSPSSLLLPPAPGPEARQRIGLKEAAGNAQVEARNR